MTENRNGLLEVGAFSGYPDSFAGCLLGVTPDTIESRQMTIPLKVRTHVLTGIMVNLGFDPELILTRLQRDPVTHVVTGQPMVVGMLLTADWSGSFFKVTLNDNGDPIPPRYYFTARQGPTNYDRVLTTLGHTFNVNLDLLIAGRLGPGEYQLEWRILSSMSPIARVVMSFVVTDSGGLFQQAANTVWYHLL
jgi:hypothetical protein